MKTSVSSEPINATPGAVYELIADLPRQGRFTRECTGVAWLGDASKAEIGARFRGFNRRGRGRWTTTGQIVAADPGKVLAYRITSVFGIPVADWRYEIRPDGSGCVVEESTVDRRPRWFAAFTAMTGLSEMDRSGRNRSNMVKTLARLKELAES